MTAISQIRKDCVRILGYEADPRTDPIWNEIRKLEERHGSTAVAEAFTRWATVQAEYEKFFEKLMADCYPNGDRASSLADAKARLAKVIEELLADCYPNRDSASSLADAKARLAKVIEELSADSYSDRDKSSSKLGGTVED
jgi:hypothetical protein